MFVYVVIEGFTWEGDSHIGVFTSLAAARKAKQECYDSHSYMPADMHHIIERWNTQTQKSEEVE